MLVDLFSKSVRNLFLPSIWKIFLFCLLIYVCSWTAMAWGISHLIITYIGVQDTQSWMLQVLGSVGGWLIAWFLFPLLYPILISFFDDKIIEVIEHEDYPQLPPAQPPFWPTIMNDVMFSLKALGLNILCLPIYLFFPLINVFLYFGLNGYLLGMQFFRMAAGRRISLEQAKTLEIKSRKSIFLVGVGISFCSTIPVLNLAAPVLGVAVMLHLFHSQSGVGRGEILPPNNS